MESLPAGSFLSVRGILVKALVSENTQIKFFLLFLAVMVHGLTIARTVVDVDILSSGHGCHWPQW